MGSDFGISTSELFLISDLGCSIFRCCFFLAVLKGAIAVSELEVRNIIVE